MNLIHTADGTVCRRWVNLAAGIVLPGSAQFLAGRRLAGAAWFCAFAVANLAIVGLLIVPWSGLDAASPDPVCWLPLVVGLAAAVEGLRRPVPRRPRRHWAVLLAFAVAMPALVLGIRAFVIRPYRMPRHSMQPTIVGERSAGRGGQGDGERLLVDVLNYRFAPPQRGDLVVFDVASLRLPDGPPLAGGPWIKRLVGLPGETIAIEPPYVLVNGKRLTDPAIFARMAEQRDGYTGYVLPAARSGEPSASFNGSSTLGPDQYFVLGDNSQNSLDSRHFGPVPRAAIFGRAFYVFSPAGRKRWLE